MASIVKLKSGSWRAQIRRKGQYASSTFRAQADAQRWTRDIERRVDLGQTIGAAAGPNPTTLAEAIKLHIADMCEVGRAPRRSKAYCLDKLSSSLGRIKLTAVTREGLIAYAKGRSATGAGAVTISMELGYIRTVLVHASAVHGIAISSEPVDLARVALKRLGLVGKGQERDRRPSPDELARILRHLESKPRQTIPVARIVRFAIATGLRQEEISRIVWNDVDETQRILIVRNRKHPREMHNNNQTIALVSDAGWDPLTLLAQQAAVTQRLGRVFPYSGRSVGAAFRRACRDLGILDLRFHDLRHETASRLFEAGYQIPEVALVTGHKDWKMLRRYTNLKAQDLAIRKLAECDRKIS
jgi:integrase